MGKGMKKALSIILIILIAFSICACGKKNIKINEPTKAGSWEYTILKIEFARSINTSSGSYESFYSPDDSFGAYTVPKDDHVFAIVTYSMKNIGKERIRLWEDLEYRGIGKFVYGDGYIFDNNNIKIFPSYYDENESSFRSVRTDFWLEPLSSAVECKMLFIIPENIVEDTNEKLFYQVTFDDSGKNTTLRCEITNREIVN